MKTKRYILLALSLLLGQSAFAHSKALTPEFVDTLVTPYLHIQQGLAGDSLDKTKSAATSLMESLKTGPDAEDAQATLQSLDQSSQRIAVAEDIETARAAFYALSKEFQSLVEHVGTTGKVKLYLGQCPMALNYQGATWVQGVEKVSNPYFGASMLTCGSTRPLE